MIQESETKFILFALVSLGLWGALTFDALISMEYIWRRSDTFAHGYFILPISLWLVWRSKHQWHKHAFSFSRVSLIPLSLSLALFLFASAADVNALVQLSAVAILVCTIWMLVGNKVAWQFKFPLAFLFFLVPIGQNIIPALQDITAWFTVFFLQLTGIPVFRDGLYIQTPTGLFEVAVACSGIRYLIASAAVGALYAYLTYSKLKKQIIFFIFALILPIIANGIRAYLIVAIAHYSDMKYATGADHLVYGWFFFGIVIMLMFWIGGFFADPLEKTDAQAQSQNTLRFNAPPSIWFVASAVMLIAAFYLKSGMYNLSVPSKPSPALAVNDVQSSGWGITFDSGISRSHVEYADGIEVLVADYGHKQETGELITWENVWFNRDTWTIINRATLAAEGGSFALLTLRNTKGIERTVLYRYQIGDYSTTSATKAKIYQALSVLSQQHSLSSVIAISFSHKHPDASDLEDVIHWIAQKRLPIKQGER